MTTSQRYGDIAGNIAAIAEAKGIVPRAEQRAADERVGRLWRALITRASEAQCDVATTHIDLLGKSMERVIVNSRTTCGVIVVEGSSIAELLDTAIDRLNRGDFA